MDCDLLRGEVNDISAQVTSDKGETALLAAVVEWKLPERIKSTCLMVYEIDKCLGIVLLGSILLESKSKSRFTKCIWMTAGPHPALGILHVSQRMTSLRKFSVNRQEKNLLFIADSFLTYEKITTCTSFYLISRQYLVAGTASGEILLFSLDPLRLERRAKICESPITSIAVGPQATPVLCTTSLCGTVNFQPIWEIPRAISSRSFVVCLLFYSALFFLSFTKKPWVNFGTNRVLLCQK
uniref:Uncharacterized protein n=1 Tax=Paramoeba aestuarina TaxID=180227 RepID=A0A7S4PGP4_9EUKA